MAKEILVVQIILPPFYFRSNYFYLSQKLLLVKHMFNHHCILWTMQIPTILVDPCFKHFPTTWNHNFCSTILPIVISVCPNMPSTDNGIQPWNGAPKFLSEISKKHRFVNQNIRRNPRGNRRVLQQTQSLAPLKSQGAGAHRGATPDCGRGAWRCIPLYSHDYRRIFQ